MEDTQPSAQARVVLIFGATGGIGSELSKMLVADGIRLAVAGRNQEKVDHLAQELNCKGYTVDARNFDEVELCVKDVVEHFGQIDGVVNCAGSLLLKPAHLTTENEFHEVIETNLKTAFACVRSGAKAMRSTGGSIVLVSSAAARIGLSNHEAIGAAKAAVAGLAQSAACTYARQKIRVNCVAPGMVETPLTAQLLANETNAKGSRALHPLGRLGRPSDIASAISWLLNPASDWITGQIISVDGGLSTLKGKAEV